MSGLTGRITTVVFDFDGVLVDSNALKYRAFFTACGDGNRPAMQRVMAAHGDEPRRKIFERLVDEIDATHETSVEALVDGYSRTVRAAIVANGPMPGAVALLRQLAARGDVFVSSLTPEDELVWLLRRLGLGAFVTRAFGWPAQKRFTLARLVADGVVPNEMVVVGDGVRDRDAAESVGCHFIGVANAANQWEMNAAQHVVSNLRTVAALLGVTLSSQYLEIQ